MAEHTGQDAPGWGVPEEEAEDAGEEDSPHRSKQEEVGSAFDSAVGCIVMGGVARSEPCRYGELSSSVSRESDLE